MRRLASNGMPDNLAYVFWHWPRAEVQRASYEEKLASFTASLNANRASGFVEALSFRVGSLPWGLAGASVYEDWYVVRDFAALGALNDAAVSDGARSPHDTIAKDFMKGAGGVFKSVIGALPLGEARVATWIEKTIGPSYQSYYDDLARALGGQRYRVWRRQMVLGPSPQFCVQSAEPVELPSTLRPYSVRLQPIGAA